MPAQTMENTVKTADLDVDLKRRSDLHLARKIWHMVGVSIMAAFYAYAPETWSLTILMVSFFLFVPLDFARQRSKTLNDLMILLFKPIMRQSEVNKLAGTTFLITGTMIVAYLFPRDVVLLTLLFLAFADPVASYFGIRFGKDKIFGEKSLQGSLAAFFVCTIVTYLFLNFNGLLLERILIVSLIGGLIGALAELIPIWKLDDNLTLPVLSASALWLVFSLFGAFAAY